MEIKLGKNQSKGERYLKGNLEKILPRVVKRMQEELHIIDEKSGARLAGTFVQIYFNHTKPINAFGIKENPGDPANSPNYKHIIIGKSKHNPEVEVILRQGVLYNLVKPLDKDLPSVLEIELATMKKKGLIKSLSDSTTDLLNRSNIFNIGKNGFHSENVDKSYIYSEVGEYDPKRETQSFILRKHLSGNHTLDEMADKIYLGIVKEYMNVSRVDVNELSKEEFDDFKDM